MFSSKQVAYYSFIGAVLIFVIPPILFLGLSDSKQIIGVLFKFVQGWFFLGVTLFYQAKIYIIHKKRIPFYGWCLMLLFALITCDLLLDYFFESVVGFRLPRPAPLIPDTIAQNLLLSIVSLAVVHQYFLRKNSEESRLQIVELENENLQLQLSSLQNQLNPHFFFNSLNTLSELIYLDVEKSEAYINELSKVFRYILDMQRHPLVNLDKELKFIKSYFFLLKIRYDDKINLDCRIENAASFKIPSLSLLVLFENVIKHNAINAEKPMTISMEIEGTSIVVRNNKNNLQLKQHSFGIGLKNLSNRCMLLTKRNCIIEDEEHFFTVKTPLVKDKGYQN